MFLKSIELFGFKSFPEKTKLEFAEGITALLGPNGCGKSNIVDAVKWVLGEQSTRTLRAENMEDVIFNGTEARKALSVAEVVLTVSNEKEELSLGFPEIAVKRRLFRSGESEYVINGTPARLKDIRELFFDTGVGKSAYSIMEQGRIDQILLSKPEDRRYIFEEAAGITKYRARESEAGRKLERTRENLRQVESILTEVKRSYETLKRQAEKTETYREQKERAFNLELDIYLLRLKAYLEQSQSLEAKVQGRSQEKAAIKEQIDAINTSIEQGIDQVNSMETSLVESQKQLYRIGVETRSKESQIRMLGERKGELERKIQAEDERRSGILRKIEALHQEEKSKQNELAELDGRLRDVEANIRGFEVDISQFESRIQHNETSVAQLRRDSRSLEAEVEALRIDLRRLTDDIVTQLDQKLKDLGFSTQERIRVEQEIASCLESIQIQLSGRLRIAQDLLHLKTASAQEAERLLASSVTILDEASRRLEHLSGLFRRYQEMTPSFLEDFLAPEGIITRKRGIDGSITERLEGIAEKRQEAELLEQENVTLRVKILEYRQTLEGLRVNQAQMLTRRSGLENERGRLNREIEEQEEGMRGILKEIEGSQQQRRETEELLSRMEEEKESFRREEEKLKGELERLEGRISKQNSSLGEVEKKRKGKMEKLDQVQGALEKMQLELAALNAEIRSLYQNFNEQHSLDLAEYEPRMYSIEGSLKDLRSELNARREEIKKLGQVNLMAPEEFAEVSERYEFLSNQMQDLRQASTDLERITRQIRQESSELFLATYNIIRKNFHLMFRRLFGGGRAELQLVAPDNILESGVEMLAQPPGKKLENIDLLSGGEKSLTAIALLFAFYMVKPSPFCILDEIDAALDEQNVLQFINLLREFSKSSQFILITHNKKTVAGANALIGITMEESGVSKIVALRLENRVVEKSSA